MSKLLKYLFLMVALTSVCMLGVPGLSWGGGDSSTDVAVLVIESEIEHLKQRISELQSNRYERIQGLQLKIENLESILKSSRESEIRYHAIQITIEDMSDRPDFMKDLKVIRRKLKRWVNDDYLRIFDECYYKLIDYYVMKNANYTQLRKE